MCRAKVPCIFLVSRPVLLFVEQRANIASIRTKAAEEPFSQPFESGRVTVVPRDKGD